MSILPNSRNIFLRLSSLSYADLIVLVSLLSYRSLPPVNDTVIILSEQTILLVVDPLQQDVGGSAIIWTTSERCQRTRGSHERDSDDTTDFGYQSESNADSRNHSMVAFVPRLNMTSQPKHPIGPHLRIRNRRIGKRSCHIPLSSRARPQWVHPRILKFRYLPHASVLLQDGQCGPSFGLLRWILLPQ